VKVNLCLINYAPRYEDVWEIGGIDPRTLNLETVGWLRHYAVSRKVAGSIPDEIVGFFQFGHNIWNLILFSN
jgi:hypothetical protein